MNTNHFSAFQHIYRQDKRFSIKPWGIGISLSCLAMLFLPWTQNIRAIGNVTTLRQEHRPQQINTIIGGRVDRWFVKEGDYVHKGDTIVQLSETKAEYLDPSLLERTRNQLQAKQAAVDYYQNKISATDRQIQALGNAVEAKLDQVQTKLRQASLKILSDSMDMIAAINDLGIASQQLRRQQALYDSGLVSQTQLESRNQYYQSALAKKVSAENKYLASRQELLVTRVELTAVQQDYAEKKSKTESDRFGSLSSMVTGKADVAKLENLYASYQIRNGMYYVIAPQNGQIVEASASGIGEILKEGDALVHIVPERPEYAVELYVRPIDLPLISIGQEVRFLFDGFPAVVFSGWPRSSYGTYAGTVSAIEGNMSENGKFKVLVKEDSSYRKWPPELKMGTGANGIALLKTVPVWYELWRNINSFPPDYYKPSQKTQKK